MIGATSVHYQEGAAPFGEMDIILPHNRGEPQTDRWVWAAQEAGRLSAESWLESIDSGHVGRYDSVANVRDRLERRDAGDIPIDNAVARRYMAGLQYGETAAAYATTVAPGQIMPSPSLVGSAYAAREAVGGEPSGHLLRLRSAVARRLYGSEVIIGDVNVTPERRKQGLAVALIDATLSTMPFDTPATTYIHTKNLELISKVESLGFSREGTRSRNDLFGNGIVPALSVSEVRMVGPTVRRLREMLRTKYSWLTQSADIPT